MSSAITSLPRVFGCLSFFLIGFPLLVFSQPHGTVGYTLEWGSSVQTYTYIFSGRVLCQNQPCSHAQVELTFETTNQGITTQTATADAEGRYQMEVSFDGTPEDSSNWRLQAHSLSLKVRESAESEGRLILIDGQNKVVVERPLHLTQA